MLTSPRPLLCLGEVMHFRLRPRAHRFRYRVFFMRLPLVALSADPRSGSRFFSFNRFNLLAFHERDHGDGKQAALPWIRGLLQQHGIHDVDGEIWLQCFPRVLGYVFNPVAFWFCQRADGSLRAVVCEVRNTFGEKHLYLLEQGNTVANGAELQAQKIFHVSPFCDVSGHYRFRFLSTPGDGVSHLARIDYDDGAGPLLLTALSGKESTLDDRTVLKVLWRYPLMTIGVVVRIHVQALRLWLKHVPFFSKPVPPAKDLSR